MFQMKTVRAFAILTLAAVLVLAGSAPAQAAQRPAPGGLWSWFESVWTEGIRGLWQAEKPAPARKVPGWAKQGVCINPDGCANLLTGSPGPACSRFNDQGACINPDG